MRKLFATIALCIILIGTFAPVSISVSQETQPTNTNQETYQITLLAITLQTAFAEESPDEIPGFNCGVFAQGGVAAAFGCGLVEIIVTILTFVPNAVASLFGILADIFLKISISPETYGATGSGIESGIRTAWKIIRDFANIGFIFALFVSAFSLIAGKDFMGDPKKTVVKVIIMALLINFSLLFCRIIIQTADVFSGLLYNRIAVQSSSEGKLSGISEIMYNLGYKPMSFKFLELTQPQNLFTSSGITSSMPGSNSAYLIVGVLIFFVLFMLIFLFIHMGIIFLGRIIGLWLGMILAPIAFVSYAIPFIEDNKYFGFKNWLTSFTKLAFVTPLFLFFVYLAIVILDLGSIAGDVIVGIEGAEKSSYLVSVVGVLLRTLLPLIMALFVVMQGKKIATEMAGVIGEFAGKLGGMVSTVALGAATGGTGMLARQTLGRAGAAIGNSSGLINAQAKGGLKGWGAGMLRSGGKGLGAASFDVRNNSRAMGMFGKATGAMGEKIDLGTKFMNTGGYKAEGAITAMPGKYFKKVSEKAEERKKAEKEQLLVDMKEKQEKAEAKTKEKLEQEKAKLVNEEGKIKSEAENQSADTAVDTIVDQANQNLSVINQLISDIDAKIVANGFKQTDHDNAKTAKDAADSELARVEKEIKDNEEKIKNGDMAALAERSTLDREKQDKLARQQIATNAFNDQELKKQTHEKLSSDKKTEELNRTTEQKKITRIGKYNGKTIDQARGQLEIDKLEAENSQEGIKIKESKEQEKVHADKLKELAAKLKQAKTDGDLAEVQNINAKIKDETDKLKLKKAETKAAEKEFDRIYNFKAIEDEIKKVEKDYIKSQSSRLKDFQDTIHSINVNLKTTQVQGKADQKKVMETYAANFDGAANNRGAVVTTTSNIVGVISGGRYGGSNLNNNSANISAANSARSSARGK